jgi:predicted Rossmann fold nucleotide-binding protein DprA/Smf involved in DNA uptake
MISLNLRNDNGRLIFIAPHPPGSETINNRLINEGAILADSAQQMLDELGWKNEK